MKRILPLLFLALGTRAVAAQVPRLHRTTEHLTLDGRLAEAVWQRADSIDDFRQRDPMEGAAASERTVVRFVGTADGLWVGIHAYDREPNRILHAQLRRDTDLSTDDGVQLMLSPLGDKRTAFWFAVNANGAVTDAELLTFESENLDWDGVWDARAQIGADGWTAELFIPWQSLRYVAERTAWDVNVRRVIRRKNEDVSWKAWRRPEGIRRLDLAGQVEGFSDLPPRATVELRPYGAVTSNGTSRDYSSDGSHTVTGDAGVRGAFGLDAKLAPSRGLTLDLTTNADFAQAEVDRQVLNFSRFPLFLPERRPFFTEGAGIFDFGRKQETQLFYSRRIGLDADGSPIPLLFGARLSGRMGGQQVGLLAARTGGASPATDVVARVKRDLLSRGYLGAMLIGRDDRATGSSSAGGVDFNLPFVVHGQNLVFLGATSWTHDSSGGTPNYSRFVVDFPNDAADIVSRFERVEAGFNPTLGFVQADGIWRWAGSVELMPRPNIRGVRRLIFNLLDYNYVRRLDGTFSNANFSVQPLGIAFDSDDGIGFEIMHGGDRPTGAFEIFPGSTIQPREYWWSRWVAYYDGAKKRKISVNGHISGGNFYDGSGEEYQFELQGRMQPHLLWALGGQYTEGRFPTSHFVARALTGRVDYAVTPRLNTTLFAQWNNDANRAAVNARVRWTASPGSDLFVVLNSGWPTDLDGRSIPWSKPARSGVVVKYVQYLRY